MRYCTKLEHSLSSLHYQYYIFQFLINVTQKQNMLISPVFKDYFRLPFVTTASLLAMMTDDDAFRLFVPSPPANMCTHLAGARAAVTVKHFGN